MGAIAVYKALKANQSKISSYYSYNPFFNETYDITEGYGWMSDCSCFVGYIANFVNTNAFNEFPRDTTVSPAAVRADTFQ